MAREDTTFTFAGTAGGGGGSNNDPGSRRVSLTLVRGRAVDGNTNTVAHELGHNHGQPHVAACGADGGGNVMYPLPDGAMAVNGWSLSENALKSKAMFKELMGYCRPRWISDFMCDALRDPRAHGQRHGQRPARRPRPWPSARCWATSAPASGPTGAWSPSGWSTPDTPMSAQRYARLVLDDGRVVIAPVSINAMSDGVTREVGVVPARGGHGGARPGGDRRPVVARGRARAVRAVTRGPLRRMTHPQPDPLPGGRGGGRLGCLLEGEG